MPISMVGLRSGTDQVAATVNRLCKVLVITLPRTQEGAI